MALAASLLYPKASAKHTDAGFGFIVAFTHPFLSFPHFSAISSCNSWDIEPSCKTGCASPCQDFPIVMAC